MNCRPGTTYGRLTVRSVIGPHVVAECSCGSGEKRYWAKALRSGNTSSCGCLARERQAEVGRRSKTHGRTGTAEYRVWLGMRNRCHKPDANDYARYGARGIFVCAEWRNDFERFFRDMGPRPTPQHSIDRIDNEKGYEPSNCRWATKLEQTRNRRISINVEFRGQVRPLADWCNDLGINYYTAHRRIRRYGWSAERAFGGIK